jgi:hypothetical protein
MSFPTEAYMAAAANAAKIQADAQAQMGRSIGQGIEKIGSAIGDYKKMSSEVKSSEKFFKAMKEGGYLPSELTGGIDSIVDGEDYKHMSTAEKANIWGNIKSYTGGAIAQRNKLEQIGAETAGRVRAAQKPPMSSNPDEVLGSIFSGTPVAPKTPAAVVPVDQSGQDTTQPATDLAEFLRRKGWSGTGPVPKALMREFEASQPFPNPY